MARHETEPSTVQRSIPLWSLPQESDACPGNSQQRTGTASRTQPRTCAWCSSGVYDHVPRTHARHEQPSSSGLSEASRDQQRRSPKQLTRAAHALAALHTTATATCDLRHVHVSALTSAPLSHLQPLLCLATQPPSATAATHHVICNATDMLSPMLAKSGRHLHMAMPAPTEPHMPSSAPRSPCQCDGYRCFHSILLAECLHALVLPSPLPSLTTLAAQKRRAYATDALPPPSQSHLDEKPGLHAPQTLG